MTEREARRTLHVDPEWSRDQVRQAYMDLVKVWHPDRFQTDERLRAKAERSLQRINEAYAVLQRRTGASAPAPAEEEGAVRSESPRVPPTPPTSPSSFRRRLVLAAVIGSGAGVALSLWAALRPSRVSAPAPIDVPAAPAPSDVAPSSKPTPRKAGAALLRPESGSDLRPPIRTGAGALSARNDMAHDAAVMLSTDVTPDRLFFLRRGEKVTLLDVAPGTYRVKVMLGTGWNGRGFASAVAYYEREEAATIVTQGGPVRTPFALVIGERQGLRSMPVFRLE